MGKLLGGGGGSSSQSSSSAPWAPAIPVLEKILGDAEKLYDEKGGINAEWLDKQIADLTPEMQSTVKNLMSSDGMKSMVDNINKGVTSGIGGIGQATDTLGNIAQGGGKITSDDINKMAKDLYQSDRVNSQVSQLSKDVNEGLQSQIQNLNQQSSASGNMGSSRAGVAEGVATGKAADAIAQGSAAIQNQAMQDATQQAIGTLSGNVANQMGAAGQLGNIGLGAGQLGGTSANIYNQMLQNQLTGAGITQNQAQNILNNQWFNQQGQANAGWDNLSKLLGMGGAIGGLGGTSNTTGKGGTSVSSGMAGLGGLMSGIGAMGSMFSDASLKKNVKKKGKTPSGETEYEWEWNKSAEKRIGKKGKEVGVLAQEVVKHKPEAVKKDRMTGKMMVDYDKV